jgi:hypothetical protein
VYRRTSPGILLEKGAFNTRREEKKCQVYGVSQFRILQEGSDYIKKREEKVKHLKQRLLADYLAKRRLLHQSSLDCSGPYMSTPLLSITLSIILLPEQLVV